MSQEEKELAAEQEMWTSYQVSPTLTKLSLTATKHDQGKPELSLVSFESLAGEARAMEYGATKYSRNNYKGGMEWTRLLDASLRHITKYVGKEDLDSESGLNHIYHAKACLGMLIYYIERGLGKDDR